MPLDKSHLDDTIYVPTKKSTSHHRGVRDLNKTNGRRTRSSVRCRLRFRGTFRALWQPRDTLARVVSRTDLCIIIIIVIVYGFTRSRDIMHGTKVKGGGEKMKVWENKRRGRSRIRSWQTLISVHFGSRFS